MSCGNSTKRLPGEVWNAIQQELPHYVETKQQNPTGNNAASDPRVIRFFSPLRVAVHSNPGRSESELAFSSELDRYRSWNARQNPFERPHESYQIPAFNTKTAWDAVFPGVYGDAVICYNAAVKYAASKRLPPNTIRTKYKNARGFKDALGSMCLYLHQFAYLFAHRVHSRTQLLDLAKRVFRDECHGFKNQISAKRLLWIKSNAQEW